LEEQMQTSGLSGGASSQLYGYGMTTTRATQLEVVTAEGDRVTISTSSTRTVGYASASARAGATRATGTAYASSSSDGATISVEGSLSKKELHDIAKIVKAFERAAAQGDARQLLHRLTRPDLDTIATVAGSATTQTAAIMMSGTLVSSPAAAAPPTDEALPEAA
jgi:hypothetical protein